MPPHVVGIDVDGLHLDRIRMPGANYSHDDVSTALFDEAVLADPTLTFPVFMREQVNAVVEVIFDALIATRPEAQLSAAVWGIYERFPGCTTSQGLADYHQDSVAWTEQGIMDVLVPMMYWPEEEGACTDFRALTEEQEVWAIENGFDEIVVKTKNRFYEMRSALAQLQFDVIRFVPHPIESGESKVFLSKRLGQHVIDTHRSRRSVVRE